MTDLNQTESSREPIYFESCLTHSGEPVSTIYNCRCMLLMLQMYDFENSSIPGEAAVGFGLILHQVATALEDISQRYDFVEKKSN